MGITDLHASSTGEGFTWVSERSGAWYERAAAVDQSSTGGEASKYRGGQVVTAKKRANQKRTALEALRDKTRMLNVRQKKERCEEEIAKARERRSDLRAPKRLRLYINNGEGESMPVYVYRYRIDGWDIYDPRAGIGGTVDANPLEDYGLKADEVRLLDRLHMISLGYIPTAGFDQG